MKTENKTSKGKMPLKYIIKRNGTKVPFNEKKITSAIEKAMRSSGELLSGAPEKITNEVVAIIDKAISADETLMPTVEYIQDTVEKALLESKFHATAKGYILYREQHAQIRRIINTESVDLVDRYISQADWRVKENSNMGFSLQGLNNHIASEISKTYWLDKIYPNHIRNMHTEGDFHIHDLNLISVYCV